MDRINNLGAVIQAVSELKANANQMSAEDVHQSLVEIETSLMCIDKISRG